MVECTDQNCPIHGTLRVRGRIVEGKVIRAKTDKTIIIERPLVKYVPKYKRYYRSRERLTVHKPPCIRVNVGDIVRVGETRRISKTKNYVILGDKQ